MDDYDSAEGENENGDGNDSMEGEHYIRLDLEETDEDLYTTTKPIHIDPKENTLYLNEVQKKHAGNYTCAGWNSEDGEFVEHFTLFILGNYLRFHFILEALKLSTRRLYGS